MPTHRKRPRDFSQAAKLVIDIATGQVDDRAPGDERARGRAGGRECEPIFALGTKEPISFYCNDPEGHRRFLASYAKRRPCFASTRSRRIQAPLAAIDGYWDCRRRKLFSAVAYGNLEMHDCSATAVQTVHADKLDPII
jgi:hypothetical protein